MTVVVAVVDAAAGRVHLAADSAMSGDDDLASPVHKIVECTWGSERVVVGVAGRARMMGLLRPFEAPAPGEGDPQRWADQLAVDLTRYLFDHGCASQNDENEVYGSALIAWRDRLWEFSTHLLVPVESYWAIGHGASVAMGAIWASKATISAAELPRLGVEAALAHVTGIEGPISVAST